MDWKPDSILAVSRYVFDYIVGILWIIGGLAWAGFPKTIDMESGIIPRIASVPKIPDFVFGFVLAIAGVVLPYCVSVVLKPATLKLMGALQRLDRRFRRWWHSREKGNEAKDIGPSLDQLAGDRLFAFLKCKRRDIGREVRVTFVQVRNPAAAAYIAALEAETFFRATAVPASVFFVGGIVYRFPTPVHLPLSIIAMIILLALGSWLSNHVFDSWMLTVNAAVLLTPETEPNTVSNASANFSMEQ